MSVLLVKQTSTSVQVIPVFMGHVLTVSTLVYVSVVLDLLEPTVKQILMNVTHNHVLMDTRVLMESIPSFAQMLIQLCNPNALPLHVKMVGHVWPSPLSVHVYVLLASQDAIVRQVQIIVRRLHV